jgi:plastocyanin
VVHRHLTSWRPRATPLVGLAALAAALLVAPSALGANRRVAISHYQWSRPQIQLDLGEHVTWYWVGPDTMHSVTGSSANDADLDSDPGKATPRHSIGDTFQLTFNTPGTYDFECKLHPTVRGTVHVSSVPGDPSTEVDPIPKSHVDLTAPYVDGLSLRSTSFGRLGTALRFGIDERATVDAEYYRLVPRRHRRHSRPRRKFAGWQQWHAHVGLNDTRFANPGRHFRSVPGRYVATLLFTDASNNTARPRHLRFTIRG